MVNWFQPADKSEPESPQGRGEASTTPPDDSDLKASLEEVEARLASLENVTKRANGKDA